MFDIKIEGLDKLQRQLEQATRAFKELDGTICEIRLNPLDPTDVERAIREVERAVDERARRFRGNPLVEQASKAMKLQYRQEILRRVEVARNTH